jgi:hypothetical protein
MAKILISLSLLFLTLSAVFGVLNTNKTRGLREVAEQNSLARARAEQAQAAREKEMKPTEASIPAAAANNAEIDARIASAEADLVRFQTEKVELQAKLQADQKQIAELQKALEEAGSKEVIPDALPMPGAGDLQAQLEDTRRQLDTAERQKQLLSDKIHTSQARSVSMVEQPKQRVARAPKPNVRGTVLAVNQAYNFVVLNLGGRQGLEANSDMLVLRGGTLIGKIRVSSVEPATAIGDIITNSLARGVQVQPGDIVIYAGPNS